MLAKGKWSTPQDDTTWYAGYRRYGASKLCAVMLQYVEPLTFRFSCPSRDPLDYVLTSFIRQELDKRLASDPVLSSITVIGLDPGGMSSDLGRRGDFVFRVVKMKWLMPVAGAINTYFDPNGPLRTSSKSAGDVLRACFDIDVASNEHLYLNGTDKIEVAKDAQDVEKRKSLWKYGVEAAAIKAGDTVLKDWQ